MPRPWRKLDTATLTKGFQIGPGNPLVGLEGRAALLRSLGELALSRPAIFAREDAPRPGGFFDHLAAKAENGAIPAPLILSELLLQFGADLAVAAYARRRAARRLLAPSGR